MTVALDSLITIGLGGLRISRRVSRPGERVIEKENRWFNTPILTTPQPESSPLVNRQDRCAYRGGLTARLDAPQADLAPLPARLTGRAGRWSILQDRIDRGRIGRRQDSRPSGPARRSRTARPPGYSFDPLPSIVRDRSLNLVDRPVLAIWSARPVARRDCCWAAVAMVARRLGSPTGAERGDRRLVADRQRSHRSPEGRRLHQARGCQPRPTPTTRGTGRAGGSSSASVLQGAGRGDAGGPPDGRVSRRARWRATAASRGLTIPPPGAGRVTPESGDTVSPKSAGKLRSQRGRSTLRTGTVGCAGEDGGPPASGPV